VLNIGSWREYSAQHVAFALHRITGWLLLGWVVLHLALPVATTGPDVWNPLTALPGAGGKVLVTGLFAVLVFHAFNGIRLLAAELFGVGIRTAKSVFLSTLVASVALIVVMGGSL
jgi:succinate dehydrogenase / fumarate reductase cytochrome b subunit